MASGLPEPLTTVSTGAEATTTRLWCCTWGAQHLLGEGVRATSFSTCCGPGALASSQSRFFARASPYWT